MGSGKACRSSERLLQDWKEMSRSCISKVRDRPLCLWAAQVQLAQARELHCEPRTAWMGTALMGTDLGGNRLCLQSGRDKETRGSNVTPLCRLGRRWPEAPLCKEGSFC